MDARQIARTVAQSQVALFESLGGIGVPWHQQPLDEQNALTYLVAQQLDDPVQSPEEAHVRWCRLAPSGDSRQVDFADLDKKHQVAIEIAITIVECCRKLVVKPVIDAPSVSNASEVVDNEL